MRLLLAIEPGDVSPDEYVTFFRWAICADKKTDYGIFPFRMAYSSSLIERDIPDTEIFFIDPFIDRMSTEEFVRRASEIKPDLMIIQSSSILWPKTKEVISRIKSSTGCFAVTCGNYATVEPIAVMNDCPELDAVMIGEYMDTARDIVSALKLNSGMASIGKIAYRENDKIILTGNKPLMDINTLPWPDRKRIDPSKYRNFTIFHPTYYMLMSMGCPCGCAFCIERHIMYASPMYRFRNPADIVDEMLYLKNSLGARGIWFDDDTATARKKDILAFCSEMIKRKVKIPFGLMGDLIFSDEEIIKNLKKAGCIGYAFGVESTDSIVLKNINKPIKPEKIKEGVRLLKKYGIISHATFSFGHPGETRDSMRRTFEFAKTLGCDNAQFSIATPYPGTPFYKTALENNWLAEKDITKYYGNQKCVVSYPDLSKEEIENAVISFNREWEHIGARNRLRLGLRHPVMGIEKLRHEGLRGLLFWIKKALQIEK